MATGAWRSKRSYIDTAADPGGSAGRRPENLRPDGTVYGPPAVPARLGRVPADVLGPDDGYALTNRGNGGPVDQTSTDHEDGTGIGGGQTDQEAMAEGYAVRSRDTGTIAARRFELGRMRAADEVYTGELQAAPVAYAGSQAALLVQSEGLPANNPEGIRPGWRYRRLLDRRMPYAQRRRHDARPVRNNVAAAMADSPAMSEGNQYTSPFGWLTPTRRRKESVPMARRTPGAWDQDVITDGTGETSGESAMWTW